ncbi:hypothetical protein KC323_g173 [Hortaea werneckii]|nr:hypothetical protein KC323_g173 [Hortaea werneckii]
MRLRNTNLKMSIVAGRRSFFYAQCKKPMMANLWISAESPCDSWESRPLTRNLFRSRRALLLSLERPPFLFGNREAFNAKIKVLAPRRYGWQTQVREVHKHSPTDEWDDEDSPVRTKESVKQSRQRWLSANSAEYGEPSQATSAPEKTAMGTHSKKTGAIGSPLARLASTTLYTHDGKWPTKKATSRSTAQTSFTLHEPSCSSKPTTSDIGLCQIWGP